MKTIYLSLLERLQDIPEIRWIDADLGQLSTTDRAAIALPAALIDISLTECKNDSIDTQICRAQIIIKIVAEKKTMRTSASTPTEALKKSLEVYDLIARVYSALQGHNDNDTFNELRRTSQGPEHNSNYYVYRISFECEFEDISAEH